MSAPLLYHEQLAMYEGWLLSERSDGIWEIQKYDEDPLDLRGSDEAARSYVSARSSGSKMHAEALALHGTKVSD